MQPISANNPSELPKGLPPVQPPSGKFLAQLFLIPLGIVSVAVCILVFLNWLVGGFFTPEQMLQDLRNGNTEVRWRRASDLAQVLKRDDNLAANPSFALSIEELLRQAMKDNQQSERAYLDKVKTQPPSLSVSGTAEPAEAPKELRDERNFVEFLISCMGNFSVPVGVPLLNEIALNEDGADKEIVARRRQLAVWSLATAADNLKRFDALSADARASTLAKLDEEAGSDSSDRRNLARQMHDYLKARADGKPSALGVDRTLAKCATSSDLDLRKFAALALTFWEGTPEENERMEQTLLQLSDAGSFPDDADRVKAREVRYQATMALARRGSKKTAERMAVVQEMLDEDSLSKIFRARGKGSNDVPDTAIIGVIMTDALKSVAELHRKTAARGETVDLSLVTPTVETLASHPNPAIRLAAETTNLELKK